MMQSSFLVYIKYINIIHKEQDNVEFIISHLLAPTAYFSLFSRGVFELNF